MRAVGAPFTLGIGAHPLIARLRQHVVPPQPPQLFSIRVYRVHPPTPLKRGFLALCFPSRLCRKRKWITVGLWVLAACAGRSTRSKGSQQTLRLSHPVRVARKQAKNDFSGQAGWRGRSLGPAQKAPGPWNLPAWGRDPPGGTQTAWRPKLWAAPFLEEIGGVLGQAPRPPKLPKML